MRVLLSLFIAFSIVSCAHKPSSVLLDEPLQLPMDEQVAPEQVVTIELEGVEEVITEEKFESSDETEEVEDVPPTGIVFGKTDFLGLLKTSYVQLLVENVKDEENKYYLYVGSKENQSMLPWEQKTIEPGYFFLQLPVGEYRITSISIPVGNTHATEEINLLFTIKENTVIYLGTLQAVGTKERLKLGGVPLIQPGFEYNVAIVNDFVAAQAEFQQRYPDLQAEIKVRLIEMK